jgi:hypothetical protein
MNNKCLHCQKPTTNAKYCSRSCAVTSNNSKHPRRTKSKVCDFEGCSEIIFSSRKFCSEHRYGGRRFETIGDLRAAAKYQVNAYARYFARNWARQNLDLTKCAVCDYRTHIEIAHIEPLAKFPDDTPIAETYINNVIGLCPNHHWEFDNGYLVLSALSESRTRMCPITVSIP